MKGLISWIAHSMRRGCLLLIVLYQRVVSPYLGARCRFYPSCSEYAYLAIEQYGIFYGILLAIKRILKCHRGYHGDWYDPLITEPEKICGKK